MNEDLIKGRSYYYEFFALPLFFSERSDKFDAWRDELLVLKTSPITQDDKESFEILESFSFDEFKSEQNRILFDYSYANVPLTASFYLEGRDDGVAKQIVNDILKRSKFRKNSKTCKDSEDFIGFVFYLMSSLLTSGEDELSSELFSKVINEFVDEYIEFMKSSKEAKFYKNLASLMSSFFELERALLGITKPPKKAKSVAIDAIEKQPFISKFETPDEKYEWSKFWGVKNSK